MFSALGLAITLPSFISLCLFIMEHSFSALYLLNGWSRKLWLSFYLTPYLFRKSTYCSSYPCHLHFCLGVFCCVQWSHGNSFIWLQWQLGFCISVSKLHFSIGSLFSLNMYFQLHFSLSITSLHYALLLRSQWFWSKRKVESVKFLPPEVLEYNLQRFFFSYLPKTKEWNMAKYISFSQPRHWSCRLRDCQTLEGGEETFSLKQTNKKPSQIFLMYKKRIQAGRSWE